MQKIIKIFLVNITIFLLLIIVLELVYGNKIYPNKLNCGYLLCSSNYTYKNNLYEGKNFINYKKDKYGFRGLRKNISQIDILTIGGSTTDERYLEIEDTWSEQLERKINNTYPKLDIDIVNAGIDGQSTNGHIWNFKNWFPKIKKFKTKYVFFYIGINEYFSDEKSKYDQGTKGLNYFQKIKLWVRENNGIIYKSYDLVYRKYFLKDILNVGHQIREKKYIIVEKEFFISQANTKDLELRLDELKELTINIDAIPVFITQKTLRHKVINDKVYSINKSNYFSKEKKISKIILNYCKKNKIFCIDLFNKIEFREDSFYDLVHTTPEGSNRIANTIFNEFNLILNRN